MIEWIQTTQDLTTLSLRLTSEIPGTHAIAIDTEFVRTQNFYAQPGLLQLGWHSLDTTHIALLDLTILSAKALKVFITQLYQDCQIHQVVILMHSPSEDLALLDQLSVPRSFTALLDTQVAAAFLNLGAQISLSKLVDTLAPDHPVPTSMAQSNWTERPLCWRRLYYAASDVSALMAVAPIILDQLRKKNHLYKVLDDCICLYKTWPMAIEGQCYSTKQSLLSKTPGHLRARFAHLMEWREKSVKYLDVPRKWHLTDEALLKLSRLGDLDAPPKAQVFFQLLFNPTTSKYKKSIRLHPQAKTLFINTLDIDELRQDFYDAWQILPTYSNNDLAFRLNKNGKKALGLIRELTEQTAVHFDLPSSALCRSAWLHIFMEYYSRQRLAQPTTLPCFLHEWRQPFLQEASAILDQYWPIFLPPN